MKKNTTKLAIESGVFRCQSALFLILVKNSSEVNDYGAALNEALCF